MPFAPGTSGNPRGRPRKPRTGPDTLRADLLRQAPEILERLVGLAKGGDVPAAKEVLSRCLPPLRPRDEAVPLAVGTDLAGASTAVLAALDAGTLTPGQAAQIAATVASLARTAETTEILQRLNHIEALLNERQTR